MSCEGFRFCNIVGIFLLFYCFPVDVAVVFYVVAFDGGVFSAVSVVTSTACVVVAIAAASTRVDHCVHHCDGDMFFPVVAVVVCNSVAAIGAEVAVVLAV